MKSAHAPVRGLGSKRAVLAGLFCLGAVLGFGSCADQTQDERAAVNDQQPAATSSMPLQSSTTIAASTTTTEPSIDFPPSSPGRDGPVVYQLNPASPGGSLASVEGALSIDRKGCLRIGRWGFVWPADTAWNDAASEVVLGDGRRVRIGETLRGAGGYFDSRIIEELEMSVVEFKVGSEVAAHVVACYGSGEVAVANNWAGAIEVD